jgi:uncharacterized Zn-binding protein involved in type VI secretion
MKLIAKILCLALLAGAMFAAGAAAATLAVGSTTLAAGNAAVSSCGVSTLSATRAVNNSGNVTSVTVTGVPAACAGETLSIALVNGSNSALATSSATVPAGGGSMSFTGLGTVSAASLMGYRFAMVGV